MRLASAVGAACAGLVLATSGAAVAVAEDSVTLTGTYRRMAKEVDDGRSHAHVYEDLLVTPSRTYRLRLTGARPRPNSTVRVSATTTGSGTYSVTGARTLSTAPAAAMSGTTSTLAILAHWSSPDSVTQAGAKAVLFGDGNAWVREVSYGQSSLTGAVTPWVKISPPTNGRCYDYAEQIMARAKAGASNLGYNASAYHRTLVYFPRCTQSDTTNLSGWAYEPGDSIWLNGTMDRRTSVHEHGHSFGIGHARAYACAVNGVPVTLGGTCTKSEYGDPYDAMGQSTYAGHYNGIHKDRLGWLGKTRRHVMTTSSGTFTIAPIERASTVPVALVANGASEHRRYWMEYRQPIGMDSQFPAGATGGLMIHVEDATIGPGSYLLDPTPSDKSFATAALGVGRSWTAPDGVRISVNSASSTGITVTVTGARPEPTVPSAPRTFVAEPGHGRVRLTWQPPASDGHAQIRSYVLTASNGYTQSFDPSQTTTFVYSLANGTAYDFSLKAVNSIGTGPAAVASATPREPTQPPTVAITSPAPSSVVDGTVVVDAETKTDGFQGVSYVWHVDGSVAGYGEWFQWDTPRYPNGPHTIRVDVTDEVGRTARHEATYTVRNLRPAVTFTAPQAGSTISGGVVTLTADAVPAEDGSPIRYVEFAGSYYPRTIGRDTTAPYEVPWDITYLYDGWHDVTVRAVDAAGREHEATRTFYVSHPPPTVRITSPASGATLRASSVTVTADAAQGTPGVPVSTVQFSWRGHVVEDTTAPYSATFDTGGSSGSYEYFSAAAYDAAGRSRSTYVTVRLDNPPPALSVTSPSPWSSYRTKTVNFAGTAKPGPTGAAVAYVEVVTPVRAERVAVAADGTWSFAWDVSGRYGQQNLRVRAYDTGGFWAERSFTIDLQRPVPTVEILSPAPEADVAAGGFDIVARAVPAADAHHGVAAVCFSAWGASLGCGALQEDGTYVLRGARMPHAERWYLNAQVRETDGYVGAYAGRYVNAYAVPRTPYTPVAHPEDDATVTVRWTTPYPSRYEPVTEWVVRDEAGVEVARSATNWASFRPPVLQTSRKYSVEAVSEWGTSAAAWTTPVVAEWRTQIAEVSVTQSSTTYPGMVTITGRLSRVSDGAGIAGRTLNLYLHAPDMTMFRWTMPPTSSSGFTSRTFTPRSMGDLELHHVAGSGLGSSLSGPRTIVVRASVTGNLTRGRMALGGTTSFDGAVQPATYGKFVYLQQYSGGVWRNVTYRRQDAYGRVSVPIKPLARGSYTYRLYYGDTYLMPGTSPPRTVYVY